MCRILVLCVCTLSLLIGPGCSGTARPGPEAPTPQVLARLFGTYTSRNRGKPPAGVEQLKAFAGKLAPDELKSIGIDSSNLDKLFVSPRDGQPYIFRPPAKYGNVAGPQTVVIYEATGKGGKRLVIFSVGQTEEVDAGKFKELVPEGS